MIEHPHRPPARRIEGLAGGPAVLVVNPFSTRSTAQAHTATVRALEPFGLEQVVVSTEPGGATSAVSRAVRDGARLVAALGGDGMLAEVAGAVAGTDAAVIPLPAGGTNVFARAAGWPARLGDALAALPAAVPLGNAADLTLGRLRAGPHDRVVVVNVGLGLDAETVHWVEAHPGVKRRLRQASFVLGAWRSAVLFARAPPRLSVRVDDAAPFPATTLLVACGTPYTFLGPSPVDLVPGGRFDGHLAWRALRGARVDRASLVVARALVGQGARPSRALSGGLIARQIAASAEAPVAIQCDGEPLGWHASATVTAGPTLRTLLPDGRPSWRPPAGVRSEPTP